MWLFGTDRPPEIGKRQSVVLREDPQGKTHRGFNRSTWNVEASGPFFMSAGKNCCFFMDVWKWIHGKSPYIFSQTTNFLMDFPWKCSFFLRIVRHDSVCWHDALIDQIFPRIGANHSGKRNDSKVPQKMRWLEWFHPISSLKMTNAKKSWIQNFGHSSTYCCKMIKFKFEDISVYSKMLLENWTSFLGV